MPIPHSLRRLPRSLASRRLSAALMFSWVLLLVVWIVPFQLYGLPAAQLRAIIAEEPFFRIVYLALLVNTAFCIVPRAITAWRRAARTPSSDWHPTAEGDRREGVAFGPRAERELRDRGFRVVTGDGWVWGVKRRFSGLGTVLFHASFFVAVAAALIAADPALTFDRDIVVAEGETFDGSVAAYLPAETPARGPAPRVAFVVSRIQPEFHEDVLLFTRLDARVRLNGSSRERLVRVGTPAIVGPTTLVALKDFGYTAEIEESIDPPKGSAVAPTRSSAIYKLKAFPPGQTDSVLTAAEGGGHRIELSVYGDYVDRGGQPGVRSFNLRDPRMKISVSRVLLNMAEKPLVRDRLVRVGTPLKVPEATLTVRKVGHYGVFRVVSNPAAPVALVALLLLCAGSVMRLLLPRTEALVVRAEDGSAAVRVRRDVYGISRSSAHRVLDAIEGERR